MGSSDELPSQLGTGNRESGSDIRLEYYDRTHELSLIHIQMCIRDRAYATQLLIWETVIGERDANFNHVAASGCSNVKDVINAKHPLRNKIFSYYNSMVPVSYTHLDVYKRQVEHPYFYPFRWEQMPVLQWVHIPERV